MKNLSDSHCEEISNHSSREATRRETLRRCEEQIATGFHSFLRVGEALQVINEQRLYEGEFSNFEEYCRLRWGIGRKYAYRLIRAAEVLHKMSPIGDTVPLPSNEAQLRGLGGLDGERASQAWKRAVADAAGGRITACHVTAAVAELGFSPPARLTKEKAGDGEQDCYVESALGIVKRLEKALRKSELEVALMLFEKLRVILERIDLDVRGRAVCLRAQAEDNGEGPTRQVEPEC